MNKIVLLGRLFFAVAIIAFGIQQFIYGDFVPGRAPAWPESMQGRLIWAYGSGVIFIVAGLAFISGKKARWAAIVTGIMIFSWALLRHIPLVIADPSFGLAWTKMGKALFLFGGAFAVGGTYPKEKAGALSAFVNSTTGFQYLGRFCLGYFLIASGIQHFLFVEFVTPLVPAWIPHPLFWTYFAGGALIAGGVGLLLPPTARLAAGMSGLMVFMWFVMLHIPRAVAAPAEQKQNEWIAVFEALAVAGIAFSLTLARPKERN